MVPQPVVRLHATNPVRWQQGRAVQQTHEDGVHVALAYDRTMQRQLAFRLEIFNQSAQPVLFDPKGAWAKYCVPGASGVAECTDKRWLIDPEATVLDLEKQHAVAAADAENTETFMAGLLILSVAGDLAGAASGRSSRGSSTWAIASSMDGAGARRQAQEHHFATALDFWQAATFRRTTMGPGEAGSGLIMAPLVPSARGLTVYVPVGDKVFQFVFQQESIDPRPHYRPRR